MKFAILEARIALARRYLLAVDALAEWALIERRRANQSFSRLILSRTPEHVARMEREKGLI